MTSRALARMIRRFEKRGGAGFWIARSPEKPLRKWRRTA